MRYLGPATKIRDHLYLGSVFDIQTILNEHQIQEEIRKGENNNNNSEKTNKTTIVSPWSHILNVAEEASDSLPSSLAKTTKMIVNDLVNEEEDLKQQWLVFEKAFAFIEEAKNTNGICMVHCMRGRSRSASIVIAYLMVYEKMSLKSAYEEVKLLRPPLGMFLIILVLLLLLFCFFVNLFHFFFFFLFNF